VAPADNDHALLAFAMEASRARRRSELPPLIGVP